MNALPDPTKHCLCPGDKVMRYRTNNRGVARLVCTRCNKPQSSEQRIEFKPERVPA